TTRVLRYWDQTLPNLPDRTPLKYGYGQVWTNGDINAGICQSTDNSAHGSTVTGTGSGNGRALNKFKGVAPESTIIIVESDFSRSNWTLTVADAIDYVFAVADSLGMPAVVNTSLGDYLGSHDGTDPASQIVDSLLNEKPGRIVVAAAGNSGNWDHYHLKGEVSLDTSFTWFEVNPNSLFGSPAVFFDLWADTSNFKNVQFSFEAIRQDGAFEAVGSTSYYTIESLLNSTTNDSIMVNGFKASPVEFYCEEVNGVYHIEALLENMDSTNFLYGFNTVGLSGTYDLWSGFSIGLSKIREDNLPTTMEYPRIAHYQFPDSLYSTVSSWTCSEQVITVANFANQKDYIDQNGNNRVLNHTSGKLSINSSKGPNRIGEQKPDIAATGDGTLSACPQFLIDALVNNGGNSLAQGQKHVLNGGTSMASPVVAGIAALYLEKCHLATNIDFKNDLIEIAYSDNYTGSTPNYAYGHGKIDAFKLLNKSNYSPTVIGDTLICNDTATVMTAENNYATYLWQNELNSASYSTTLGDTAFALVTNQKGCRGFTDSLIIIKGQVPIYPTINIIGGGLVATPAFAYEWFIDNSFIVDEKEQFLNPTATGNYHVIVTEKEGCSLTSAPVAVNIETLKELERNEFVIFPNPFIDEFQIIKNNAFNIDIGIYDIAGKLIYAYDNFAADDLFLSIHPPNLPSGVYLLQLQFDSSYKIVKLIKE
ncbi:MAG: S8 family peptidase, partial [Putridiphycobacter sp.]|nr:S8 family peptidase [Putridiphycobacter sp.]